jgi:hypothetical protein
MIRPSEDLARYHPERTFNTARSLALNEIHARINMISSASGHALQNELETPTPPN